MRKNKVYLGLGKALKFIIRNPSTRRKLTDPLNKIISDIENMVFHGAKDFPKVIDIENTSICNRRCSYCPVSKYKREQGYIKKELFEKIVNELSEIKFSGTIQIAFFGEPLIDKRLPELLEYLRERLPEAFVVVYSNGDLMNKDLFYKLRPSVDLMMITEHENAKHENMRELMRELPEKDKKIIDYKPIKKIKMYNRGGSIKVEKQTKVCHLIKGQGMTIDFQGNCVLCCEDFFSAYSFGNVNKEKVLDVWRKPAYKRVREQIKKSVFVLDICKRCLSLPGKGINKENFEKLMENTDNESL